MGPDAVPAVVEGADLVKSSKGWVSLRAALVRMGSPAADALEKARPRWPKASAERLAVVLEASRAAAASSPPRVEAEVRDILERFRGATVYTSDDPRVRMLADLGRPAIPAICEVIEESGSKLPPAPGIRITFSSASASRGKKSIARSDPPRTSSFSSTSPVQCATTTSCRS